MDFSLYELIDTVISTLWIQARTKKLELDFCIDQQVAAYYFGAPDRIRQVLLNLIGNAVKFTESGNVTLKVYLNDKKAVCFDILDTGIGISQNRIHAIFDPFTQADASMSRRYGGTGLGTTISKQLVELMGGKIYASSVVGEGSTFGFSLPLKQGKTVRCTKVHSTHTLPPLNVLAADDIEQNIELLTLILNRQGHTVTTVTDGLQAVEAFKKGAYDLILMDVQTPTMDGLTATTTIRQYEKLNKKKSIPIIALTASALNEDKIAANEAGMSGFATKPVDIDLLNTEIARVIGFDLKPSNAQTIIENDTSNAIRHDKGLILWGERSLYLRELHRFSELTQNHLDTANNLLKAADFEALRHHAHAVKGVSGNLALPLISNSFAALEAAANKADRSTALDTLPLISRECERFHQELNVLCSNDQTPQESSNSKADETEFLTFIPALLERAQSGEIDDDLLDDFIRKAPSIYQSEAQKICNAFADFEFKESLTLLRHLGNQQPDNMASKSDTEAQEDS